jgi:hypothetical protein
MTEESFHRLDHRLGERGAAHLGRVVETVFPAYLGPRRKARLCALHLFPSPGIRWLAAAPLGGTAPAPFHPSPRSVYPLALRAPGEVEVVSEGGMAMVFTQHGLFLANEFVPRAGAGFVPAHEVPHKFRVKHVISRRASLTE